MQGIIEGETYIICNPAYLEQQGRAYDTALIEQWTLEGKTPLLLTTASAIIGYYAVADSIKPTTEQAIHALKAQGITPVMLTGDHKNTAEYIA